MERLSTPSAISKGRPRVGVEPPGMDAGIEVTPRLFRCRRASMAAATAFLWINLWTGSPLLALWVGSQAAAERQLSMTAVFVVVLTLAALTLAISRRAGAARRALPRACRPPAARRSPHVAALIQRAA